MKLSLRKTSFEINSMLSPLELANDKLYKPSGYIKGGDAVYIIPAFNPSLIYAASWAYNFLLLEEIMETERHFKCIVLADYVEFEGEIIQMKNEEVFGLAGTAIDHFGGGNFIARPEIYEDRGRKSLKIFSLSEMLKISRNVPGESDYSKMYFTNFELFCSEGNHLLNPSDFSLQTI